MFRFHWRNPHGSVNRLYYLFHVIPSNLFTWLLFVRRLISQNFSINFLVFVLCVWSCIGFLISCGRCRLLLKGGHCADSASSSPIAISSQPVSQPASRRHGQRVIQFGGVLQRQERVRHRWHGILGQSASGEIASFLSGYQGRLFAHPAQKGPGSPQSDWGIQPTHRKDFMLNKK